MLGRALSDKNDIDLRTRESVKKPLGKAGNADHSAAFQTQDADLVDAGNTSDHFAIVG